MDTPTLLDHLEHHGTALTLPRGAAPHWDDADLHRAAHAADPERYALLGLAPAAAPWQRARVLLQVLAASQAGLDGAARAVQARAARVLSLGLPPAHALTALLALRRLRANHKHTTRAVLRFVLEHPAADALIAARRPALRDCFEHALGAAAARGCARRIAAGDTGSDYLRRRLLRFLTDPAAAPARVQALYRPAGPERPLPADPALPAVPAAFPRFAGTVALVLDAPAPAPQAAALRAALEQVCDRLAVIETGRPGRAPHGAADPGAAGVLDALRTGGGPGPDLIAVVRDGRAAPGDLARLAAALPGIGTAAPVVVCHTVPAGDHGGGGAATRPAAPSPPHRAIRERDDLAGLLPWTLAHCAAGAPWLRTALHARLDDLERRADGLTAGLAA